MLPIDWQSLIDDLREADLRFRAVAPPSMGHLIEFDPGLTDAEVRKTEERFAFRFPPDLRDFLQTALPRGSGFPDWRSGNEEEIREWLDAPRQGILFDIEHNGFWLPEWGPVPGSLDEAFRIASELVAAAPRLIPICGHRIMPDEPHLPGNPVFSVHQTDIIVFGPDLETYLRREFELESRVSLPVGARRMAWIDRNPARWAGLRQLGPSARKAGDSSGAR